MTNNRLRRTFFSFLLFCMAGTLSAQQSLDLRSRTVLRKARIERQLAADTLQRRRLPAATTAEQEYVSGLVQLAQGATTEQLEEAGAKVLGNHGDIVMALFPIDEVECIAAHPSVYRLELSRDMTPKCDLARNAIGVDRIHTGEDLPKAYTGKGVVTGLFDAGLDPHHINFRDENGDSRISYLCHAYAANNADGYRVREYGKYSELPLSRFSTDDSTSFHGTHTLGIMAGGYKGDMTVAQKENAFSATVTEAPNPFYGMAPESDIAVGCGTLQDMFIALGCEAIYNYAAYWQKPAVINLSLGSNIGTHDGKSTLSRFFDLLGEELILCVSAGNEGELPIALNKTFAEGDTILQSFILPMYEYYGNYKNLRYGKVEIYSNDDTEFTLQAVIYNKARGTITFRNVCDHNTDNVATYYATPGYQWSDTDLSHASFSNAFEGYLGVGSSIDEQSGRYYAVVDYFTSDNTSKNAVGNYILGFVVTGHPGQRIDCFCDGTFTTLDDYDQPGWSNGTTDGSISDMACAENILVVGSYNTRDDYGSLDGKVHGYQGALPVGQMSAFTSYGTLVDGRKLPHICAPGAAIISSTSSYWAALQNYSEDDGAVQGLYKEPSRNNYYEQSLGTSMAAPVVAGAIALWLEANPNLTIHDVKDIIAKTAVVDDDVRTSGNPVQWGAGKFDAYAGLKEVIRRATGLDNAPESAKRLLVKPLSDRTFNVFLGGADQMDITLYTPLGQTAGHFAATGDELTFSAAGLAQGVYVLHANGQYTERIIVK